MWVNVDVKVADSVMKDNYLFFTVMKHRKMILLFNYQISAIIIELRRSQMTQNIITCQWSKMLHFHYQLHATLHAYLSFFTT